MYVFYHSETEVQTRRAGPRVPPECNTYHKATEEAQIVGTDVLGCPKRQYIKDNGVNSAQTRRAGPRVPPRGDTYRKATKEAQTVGTDVLGCPVSFDATR